jgi:hypothetical protein
MPTKADRSAKLSPVKPRNAMHANSSFGYGSCWRPWDREGSDKGIERKLASHQGTHPTEELVGRRRNSGKGHLDRVKPSRTTWEDPASQSSRGGVPKAE